MSIVCEPSYEMEIDSSAICFFLFVAIQFLLQQRCKIHTTGKAEEKSNKWAKFNRNSMTFR